jgi:SAM-dependent methyltransferase
MSEDAWYESYFGADYFEVYRDAFTEESTAREVDGVLALLGLEPGRRILDLACGHGRHAIQLAKRGYDVTGYDLSELFLERARSDAEAEGVRVRWLQGDMRRLPFESEFDAVLNLFTAFGYFEDPADDLLTLRSARRALVPGGRFLLEILHRDGLQGRFQTEIAQKTSNGTIVLHEYSWDLARDVIHDQITVVRPDGMRAHYRTAVRTRSLHGLLALFREAELEPVAWYGGLDGSPLGLDSRRLALIAERKDG